MSEEKENILVGLERYQQINSYVNRLEESSGFVNAQGASSRLEKFERYQRDMLEQGEDELAPEDELTGDEVAPEDELAGLEGEEGGLEGGDELAGLEGGDELAGLEGEEGGDTKEIDVTDIVDMTKEAGEKAETVTQSVEKQSEKIDSLITKLDDLESKLSGMDNIMTNIEDLEVKIEDMKPPTPIEKLELRSLDSGPFTQKPHEYWEEKSEELAKNKDKHEYVLTSDEAKDYNQTEIKDSFIEPEPDEDEDDDIDDEVKEVSVLGNKR